MAAMRPNLVYVFADQLRHDACGYAGNKLAHTPAIDALAEESMDFRQAVASAPVCAPYRASLLTGKYTTSTGMVINELRINPNQRCIGHILTEADYDTCYIGKWHLYANQLGRHDDPHNSFVPRGPDRLGFDGEWCAYNFHHENYGPLAYYHRESPEKIHYGDGVYEADAQTDLAIDYLRRRSNSSKPFAMVLSWGPPHDPWTAENTPAHLARLFDPKDFPNPPNYLPENDHYGDGWSRLSAAERAELPKWRANYAAQAASIDENLDRLLKALSELGLAENTLLVFTSDHGELFGAHGRRAKNTFYEEACRVPLLFRLPKAMPAGHVSDACIGTVDLMPTILGLLGLDPPGDVEGVDLSPLLLGGKAETPEAAMMMICGATADWQDGYEWRALRDRRHTYAIYRRDGSELLFDNVADPYQMHNLIADPACEETVARLRQGLRERMAGIRDDFQACTWYRDNWTDRDRRIIRSATADWRNRP
jgi:arylsulfatase A-like enzyme